MPTRKSFTLLTCCVVLIGSIFLTACGGGGDKPLATIDVDMAEYKFTPKELTVPPGAEVTINLKNSGKMIHNFVIKQVDRDGNSTEYWSAAIQPGESKSLTFTAPSDPGDYAVRCELPGHALSGMVGTLHVK